MRAQTTYQDIFIRVRISIPVAVQFPQVKLKNISPSMDVGFGDLRHSEKILTLTHLLIFKDLVIFKICLKMV